MKNILVTGGAGFAGSRIALSLKRQYSSARVIALDSLKRRGSELSLSRLREGGVEFAHTDIRCTEDLVGFKECDLIVECAAEPSALAGLDGNPNYVINTNLNGTINCLELARKTGAKFLFISTSRIYPVETLNSLAFSENETRFELSENQSISGASQHGVSEDFPLAGARTLYGSTKLASELFIEEYAAAFGLKAIVNRCGVLTGPWQMGKIDQGVIVLWVARHIFGGNLSYIGFGGSGKQVRDILHIDDLCELVEVQMNDFDANAGKVFNVGGGEKVSVSLKELTALSADVTGKSIVIKASSDDRPGDVRSYITDARKVQQHTGWSPKRNAVEIITQIAKWITDNRAALEPVLK